MNKNEIRKNIYKKRLSLSKEEIKNKSKQILLNLSKTKEYLNSSNIMFYVATKSEVQTEEIIKTSIKIDKNIFVPIILRDRIDLVTSKLIQKIYKLSI